MDCEWLLSCHKIEREQIIYRKSRLWMDWQINDRHIHLSCCGGGVRLAWTLL
jgi:hypothetical protein